jgi:hypothetical protein
LRKHGGTVHAGIVICKFFQVFRRKEPSVFAFCPGQLRVSRKNGGRSGLSAEKYAKLKGKGGSGFSPDRPRKNSQQKSPQY